MKGLSTAVLTLFLAATQLASLTAVRPDGFRPPSNLQVDPVLKVVVERMWQASPTFRRQCRRLAAEQGLQVRVSPDDQPTRSSLADARTALTFQGNLPVAAHVYLRPSSRPAELIAHELEHVLEQLDRVDLAGQSGNGAVWKSDRGSFETRRAIETGRRVAREIMDGTGESRTIPSANPLDIVMTLKQQDREGTAVSPRAARVSRDGRYIVFISAARLVEEDRNQLRDVYVTDLATGRTTIESVGPSGVSANRESHSADISSDGRYIVFESEAGNLTETSFSEGTAQVFLRDRAAGTIRLLTTHGCRSAGRRPELESGHQCQGTAAAFESGASDLVTSAHGGRQTSVGVYMISLTAGTRRRLDRTDRSSAVGSSMSPAISADGRYVVFASKADLTCQGRPECAGEPQDRNSLADVYLYDTESNTTKRISRSLAGGDPDGASYDPAISGDGRFVAFVSEASNLTRDSSGRKAQIYLHDIAGSRTELISRTQSGRPANGNSLRPALSFDGSTIAFQSLATSLVCEGRCQGALDDINLLWDVFVHDRRTNRMTRMSADGGDEWMENSRGPSIDGAGHVLAFGSWHPIDVSDAAHDEDLFVVRVEPARVLSSAPARMR
jgi:Tol biopolymer transport system component